MSLLSDFFTKRLIEPFVIKPGLHVSAEAAARELKVEEGLGAEHWADTFVQKKGAAALNAAGKVLDMTPKVEGGFQPGDIVLRGNSVFTTAESGWATSVTESLRTHDWHIHQSAVSHAGVVARDHDGQLVVVQMVSGDTPAELKDKLTPLQKKLGGTFLRKDSLNDFFNIKGPTPITRATVMRPKDPQVAKQAAAKALALHDSQIQGSVTHPWLAKLPHSWAPDGRGGVCSTFVNLAFDGKFDQPHHIPVTPEHFVLSDAMTQVGDKAVTDIEVAR